jgi:hypothetical protein
MPRHYQERPREAGGSESVTDRRWAVRAAELFIVLLAAHVCTPALGLAQRTRAPQELGIWATGAVGLSSHGFGLASTAAVRFRRAFVRVRYAHAEELLGDWAYDVGLLAGVAVARSPRVQVAAGAGIGRVGGQRGCLLCRSAEIPKVVGVLADLEARWAVTRFFGVSAYSYLDVNKEESFGGVTVGLYLGRL